VRGEVSIKRPTSKIHYLYLVSDILVATYVLSSAEPAESDSNSAYSTGAVAARRHNGVAVPQRASAQGMLTLPCAASPALVIYVGCSGPERSASSSWSWGAAGRGSYLQRFKCFSAFRGRKQCSSDGRARGSTSEHV